MNQISHSRVKNISRKLRQAITDNVVFGDVLYEPGGRFGPRIQHDYQLVVVQEGEANVQVDQHLVHIAPGEVGLFPPGRQEVFSFSPAQRTRHTWCSLRPACVAEQLTRRLVALPAVQKVSHRFAQIMELGLGLPLVACREAPELAESLALCLFHEFAFSAQAGAPSEGHSPDALRRFLDWIGAHANESADLPLLARSAGVSPSQLVKLCKRHLGITPMRALWEARTRRGVRMLRDTGLSVSEVGFQCGFQTPFHFSRWVKTLEGRSPREVRSQAWGRA